MSKTDRNEESEEDNPLRLKIESKYNQHMNILKTFYGITSKAEILRFLLNKEVRRVKQLSFLEKILDIDKEEINKKIPKVIKSILKGLKEL